MKTACLLAIAAILHLASPQAAAYTTANVTFSGGSGSTLTITLADPISFTLLGPGTTDYIGFTFLLEGAGFNTVANNGSGNISYSVNGGAALAITNTVTGDSVSNTNLRLGHSPFLTNNASGGDTVILSAGTWTTSIAVAAAAPASGTYNIYMANNGGIPISADAVPEPSTYALLGLGAIAVGLAVRRRRLAQ